MFEVSLVNLSYGHVDRYVVRVATRIANYRFPVNPIKIQETEIL